MEKILTYRDINHQDHDQINPNKQIVLEKPWSVQISEISCNIEFGTIFLVCEKFFEMKIPAEDPF